MRPDDSFDELTSSVSDGRPIDWSVAESATEDEASLRALRDLARIADFNRALQRPVAHDPAAPAERALGPSAWGPFTLLEAIGAGANGEVWRAWDASLHREVAIKFLQPRGRASVGVALLDEARAVARVRHPGIVHVYGIGEFDGRVGMWMEFLRGPTLAMELERGGARTPRETARIGAAVCAALEALDQGGLIHRDLKPSNIVLEADGRVVLTDFGLGSRLTFLPESSPGSTSGTPLFMAPSLLEGGPATPRTDLYALGVTLRWALTGRPPFHAHTLEELKEQARRGAGPLTPEAPGAPPALVTAIERAMEVSAGARPYDAATMRRAMEGVLETLRSDAPAAAPSQGAAPSPTAPRGPARPSIAVLPFLDRGLGEAEYFADGLADELVQVLSKVSGLHVAARTSSFQFKGKHEDLEVIGRTLRVATILEGSVRASSDRVRIGVRLVAVSTGEQIWSESYDRPLDDLFAVQDEIARRVVEALRAALLPTPARDAAPDVRAEIASAVRGRGHDPEAHRLFLLARFFAFRRTLADLKRGAELYEEVVARDPSHALAWAEYGNLLPTLEDYGEIPVGEGYRRGREAIEKALALEPDLPEGHARLGRFQAVHDRDWRKAEASFRRALQGDPRNATVLHGAAIVAQALGRSAEAIELNRRAIATDPLGAATYNNLGAVYYESGRFQEAEQSFRHSLELTPHRLGTHAFLAQVLARQDRIEEAEAAARQETDDVFRLLAFVVIHEQTGRAAESDAVLREMKETYGSQFPVQVAEAHGVRGEVDAALEWLEKAFAARDGALAHVKPSPHFHSLAGDPRWPAFLARLGLAE